ncbi:hypothetical protein BCR35DRAFT_349228 [Leucosporidium creatinivorum]|uniref:Uncharacterized protein n=1 Tax=Leucosporidium creatinivorum TaxID=106004 RepID=A0A1Y2G4R2_9BASI|nr:hypothetical protein BCR35DRAFT_349228 [Leucosporidium creatinivorum]
MVNQALLLLKGYTFIRGTRSSERIAFEWLSGRRFTDACRLVRFVSIAVGMWVGWRLVVTWALGTALFNELCQSKTDIPGDLTTLAITLYSFARPAFCFAKLRSIIICELILILASCAEMAEARERWISEAQVPWLHVKRGVRFWRRLWRRRSLSPNEIYLEDSLTRLDQLASGIASLEVPLVARPPNPSLGPLGLSLPDGVWPERKVTLSQEAIDAVKATAWELAILDRLPTERRRIVARAVSFALGRIDRLIADGSSDELSQEKIEQLYHLPDWQKKIRHQYYYLHRALMIAEERDLDALCSFSAVESPPFLWAWIKQYCTSWIHLYKLEAIRTHRSADDPSSLPTFAEQALRPWRDSMLKLVAHDQGRLRNDVALSLLWNLEWEYKVAVRERQVELWRSKLEVAILDLVLLWKEKKRSTARR